MDQVFRECESFEKCTEFYCYRRSFHRTMTRFYDVMIHIFDYYFVNCFHIYFDSKIDDAKVASYVSENFSYKQQFYIWKLDDKTLISMIESWLLWKEMRDFYFENISKLSPKQLDDKKNFELALIAKDALDLIAVYREEILDPENKSTILNSVIPL